MLLLLFEILYCIAQRSSELVWFFVAMQIAYICDVYMHVLVLCLYNVAKNTTCILNRWIHFISENIKKKKTLWKREFVQYPLGDRWKRCCEPLCKIIENEILRNITFTYKFSPIWICDRMMKLRVVNLSTITENFVTIF